MRAESLNCTLNALFLKKMVKSANDRLIAEKMKNYGIEQDDKVSAIQDVNLYEKPNGNSKKEIDVSGENLNSDDRPVSSRKSLIVSQVQKNPFKDKLKMQIRVKSV